MHGDGLETLVVRESNERVSKAYRMVSAVLFLVLCISTSSSGQIRSRPAPKPTHLPKLVGVGGILEPLKFMLDTENWQLYLLKQSGAKTSSQAKEDLQDWLTSGHSPQGVPRAEFDLVYKYRRSLSMLLDSMKYIGDEDGELLYKKGDIPFLFADHEGSLTLVVSSIASGEVYNTLRLNGEARAYKVAVATALPVIRDISEAFESDEIRYFAIEVCYGSRNFLEDEKWDTHGEALMLVVLSKEAREYDAAQITREDFLGKAEAYIFNSQAAAVEKIRLPVKQ